MQLYGWLMTMIGIVVDRDEEIFGRLYQWDETQLKTHYPRRLDND